jgi:DNA-binding IclR family transcriptional regulator
VLDGAFAVLEALACADEGLGLTALARASALAKTSAYRLAEQLVALDAVQRVDHRYYVGARIGQIGQRWQPGRVLYAVAPATGVALPACWTAREWQQLRGIIREPHATVVDHQEAFPGIYCVSAPVWWPNGTCAGAVTAVLHATKPTPNLGDLVVHAARRIGAGLR